MLHIVLFSLTGMLPVISTRPLMNFELTLSPDGTRVGNHRCSNLLDFQEVTTGHSFITASTRNPDSMGDAAPYQFSGSLRGNNTLRFYRNLNLEACLWEFSSYYHMSELLTDCGGTIGTDGQVGPSVCVAQKFRCQPSLSIYLARVFVSVFRLFAQTEWHRVCLTCILNPIHCTFACVCQILVSILKQGTYA